jgi:hypothetical protein
LYFDKFLVNELDIVTVKSNFLYFRRDTIVTRGDASQKINKKVLTKGTFERQMNETRKKIKQTIQVYLYSY